MTVKVITDSCSDITQEEAKRLGMRVVPAYLRFGDEVYRDGVDMDSEEFYRKLETSPVHPSTSAPSPGDFAKVYEEAARETNEIVSIHVTKKHSAVYDAALLGKEVAERKGCQIEVIDSKGVTMWQGLVAIAAAKTAAGGGTLQQVTKEVHKTVSQLRALAILDTLKYAVKGGRLSNAIFAIESLLSVKAFITLRDGEVRPAGLARNRSKGMDRLREFIKSAVYVENMAIAHSTTPGEVQIITDYIRSLFPSVVPQIARLGPALGVHAGPGALAIIISENKSPVKIRNLARIKPSHIGAI